MTSLDVAFAACGVIALGGGLAAITTRYVVHAALWLVVALMGVAGALLVLGGELVALILVLVYVGAVVVLVLFALMLTRAPIGPDAAHRVGALRNLAAITLGMAATALLAAVLVPFARSTGPTVSQVDISSTDAARELFVTWVWPFEVLSVLLLVALVGALALSRPSSRLAAPHRPAISTEDPAS